VGQGTLDEVMRNGIKEGSDVQIDHPVAVPAPLANKPQDARIGVATPLFGDRVF